MAEPVISVRGLRKSYGAVEAVRGIDLEVERGEVFALLGPNGAGKTTTVEILEGYRRRSGGEVEVLGEDPANAGRGWRERIGIVLQSCRLDPYLTVRESLALFAGYYRAPRPVEEVIALVGLDGEADTRARRLSGGQQRRLDVGMALVGDPELLFLDEPTTGFDPSARRQAWETIAGLRDLGKTVVLTTHYMDEAQRLADRVTIVAHGEIVARGTPESLGDRGSQPATISYRLDGEEVRVETATPVKTLNELTGWALTQGVELERLEVRRPSLEDVYLELTEPKPEDARMSLVLHQFRYDQKAFWRNPASVFFTVMFPVVVFVILAVVFNGETVQVRGGVEATTYYVPAIMTLSIISATMQTLAMTLVIAREDGRLKRGRGTPMPPWVFIAGRVGSSIVVALLMLALLATIGGVLYGVTVPWDRLPAILLTLIVGAAAFCCLGIALTAAIPSQDAAAPIVNALLLPLYFLSGVFIPEDQLPSGVIHFADLFPVRHFFDAFFDAYVPAGGSAVSWDNLAVVAIWGIAGLLLAIRFFRWTPRGG